MSDFEIDDTEIAEALSYVCDGDADLDDVLLLVNASFERERDIAPGPLQLAVIAKFETDRDFANGGADQFVWNNGPAQARAFGDAWRAVGAIENGDLLHRLADAHDAMHAEHADEDFSDDPLKWFMAYRKRVGGPYFGLPEPGEELAEALVEWAIEHADEFDGSAADASGSDERAE